MKKQLVFVITLLVAVLMIGTTVFAGITTDELQDTEIVEDAGFAEDIEYTQDLITVEAPLSEEGEIVIGDYSRFEIPLYKVEVTDAEVENEVDIFLSNAAEADGTEPELTDELVSSLSLTYFGKQINTVEELRPTIHDLLYRQNLITEIWSDLTEEANVISYNEEQFNVVRSYMEAQLEYEVFFYTMYGIEDADAETIAQMYGYATAQDFVDGETMSYMNDVMLLDKIAEELGITYTDEDVDDAIAKMMIMNGLETSYTIEEFKEESGEAWVFLESKLDVEYNLVMNALIENAEVVDNGEAPEDYYDDASTYGEASYILDSFTAQTLDGGTFTEEDLHAKDVTMMYVWSTTCGYCVDEMPELAEFAANLPDNVQLITYCLDASYFPEQAQSILEQSGITGVTLTGGDAGFAPLDAEMMYTPTLVVLNSSGQVVLDYLIGAGDLTARYTDAMNQALELVG